MKNPPVIAVGLDAADPVQLERWMAEGKLKNLKSICDDGVYGRLKTKVNYQTESKIDFSFSEALWVMMQTGCLPNKTGFWDPITYHPERYEIGFDSVEGGYDYQEYAPFYAFAKDRRILAFDVPVSRVREDIDGIQITGWGGHHPFVRSESIPASALQEIIARYGENPVFRSDNGYRWKQKYIDWVTQSVYESIENRGKIYTDLMAKGPWDLFLTVMGETHTLGHDLFHLSEPHHPLYQYYHKPGSVDPIQVGLEKIDAVIGQLLEQASDQAYIAVFGLHGMDVNHLDHLCMLIIGEVMYRFSFPGQCALPSGNINEPPGPVIYRNIRNSWYGEFWRQLDEPNPLTKLWNTWTHKSFLQGDQKGLRSPYKMKNEGVPLGDMPVMCYSSLWPKMKAFALPGFSDGYIRINVKGREANGIVDPSEYDSVCSQIENLFYRLKDGRTGKPLVKKVVRTRQSPYNDEYKMPHGDLNVIWDEAIADVVDSPDVGRIGPIYYNRTGGHRNRGFFMAKGPGIAPGSALNEGGAVDVGATLLGFMGADIPNHFDGKPLVEIATSVSV
jgi:predicted AlkP superfamily phosphohydrolase/phosphomutase